MAWGRGSPTVWPGDEALRLYGLGTRLGSNYTEGYRLYRVVEVLGESTEARESLCSGVRQ